MPKMEKLPDSMTLGEARKILREKVDEGLECPCCTQHVQRYSRPITSAMGAGLIMAARHQRNTGKDDYFHAEDFFKFAKEIPSSIRGDFSKLRFWGLIKANDENEGYYQVTEKGHDFVNGTAKVESNVLLFNNKSYGFKGNYVDIHQCLKKKFDYEKLMAGIL